MRASSSSAVRSAGAPSKRIAPFSTNTTRSVRRAATASDCSTTTMVWPSSRSAPSTSSRRCTTSGASPSESSSTRRTRRLEQQRAPERHHLLLAPRQRRRVLLAVRGEGGEHVVDALDARGRVAPGLGMRDQRGAEVLVDGEAGEHVGAAHLDDAAAARAFALDLGEIVAVERDRARRWASAAR